MNFAIKMSALIHNKEVVIWDLFMFSLMFIFSPFYIFSHEPEHKI